MVSVLIPARNEEANIAHLLESVLQSEGADFEVLVWDDASTDRTAEKVREFAAVDARVRLLGGTPLPEGWAGKPHACQRLAENAIGEVLLFLDADVRLRGRDALARLSAAFASGSEDLLSGVPHQRVETLAEQCIVPLIHFVLLGFLPMSRMRATTDPRFAAACGQLMAFRKGAYFSVGGHALAKRSFHEGIALARAFRKAGCKTDLFDASDFATCRMYRSAREVWFGFAKNAHEGMASPKAVLPMSLLLLLGQVFPAAAMVKAFWCGELSAWGWFLFGVVPGGLARALLASRFQQPLLGALLHPLSVALLLLNQWYGAARHALGRPVGWRGRVLNGGLALFLSVATLVAAPAPLRRCPDLLLEDQFAVAREWRFPRTKPLLLVVANRSGTSDIRGWVKPVRDAFGDQIDILGLADVRGIPDPFKPAIRAMIRAGVSWPVLMDWTGENTARLLQPDSSIEVLAIRESGEILLRMPGKPSPQSLDTLKARLGTLVARENERPGR
jgi:GT2 family glycosyltransferase